MITLKNVAFVLVMLHVLIEKGLLNLKRLWQNQVHYKICPLIQRILPLRNKVTMLAGQPFKFCLVDIIENKKKQSKRCF